MTNPALLTIAVMPLDIVKADRSANHARVEAAMRLLHKASDLVVLPELFDTGFIKSLPEALEIAQPTDDASDSTLSFLRRLARSYHVAIATTYLKLASDNKPCNHGVIVEPDGETTVYDKRHLFGLSTESLTYHGGEHRCRTVRYRGWNLSMIICYDLRFPVWCRNEGLRYDLLIVPANWPKSREYAWRQLLIARAIENQAVVVGANRSGMDEFGTYGDLCFVFDHMGRQVSDINIDENSEWVYATVDKTELNKARERFPFYADGDAFKLT